MALIRIKLPEENAVKKLRELYNKRKNDRLKKYDELAEEIIKQSPKKKIAQINDSKDVEL